MCFRLSSLCFLPFCEQVEASFGLRSCHIHVQTCKCVCLHTHILAQTHQRCLAETCGLNEKRPRSGWDKQVRKFNLTPPTPVIIGRVCKGQICQGSRILGVLSGKTDLRSCLFRSNICPGLLCPALTLPRFGAQCPRFP